MKLKLGKDEPASSQDTLSDSVPSSVSAPAGEKKEDVESLRKVIKFDMNSPQKESRTTKGQEPPVAAPDTREDLEQQRTVLQNLKDFDFQIKKNHEDILKVTERVESLTRDLDDLVSLYEIVSEQMNPFVGLSKVTKKRLDALENFTREVDNLKVKIGDIESILERHVVPVIETDSVAAPLQAVADTVTQPGPAQPPSGDPTDVALTTAFDALVTQIDSVIDDFLSTVH